jgi:uncharacterized protein (DUF488 family)
MGEQKVPVDAEQATGRPIFTIGHSTRAIEQFIELLHANGVTLVVDVRTIARSRHNPQFNGDALPETLAAAGIGYRHLAGLGGLRHARADSVNVGWRNASFRGFADYMQTEEFAAGLDELLGLAKGWQVAIMCAEAVPWRCHRALIADALFARGIRVEHIISPGHTQVHEPTPFAHIEGQSVIYPAAAEQTTRSERRQPTDAQT